MRTQLLREYFSFSKKERTGIMAVLIIMLLLVFIPFLFPLFIRHTKADAAAFQKDIATLDIKQQADSGQSFANNEYDHNNYNHYPPGEKKTYSIKGELFYFDPNTITAADWKRLGVRDKTISTIQHYTAKGGRFRQPEDLEKIWGFFPDEIERLKPYVQVQQQEAPAAQKDAGAKTFNKDKHSITAVDINTGDTAAYIALPGIGSKLAQRIITFRDKLGGFYKVEQVAETFGLPDSTFQKIKPYLLLNDKNIRQVNINTATVDELKSHPYIRWNIANAIVQYRAQHGNFATIGELKNIMLVDDAVLDRITPYIKLN